jgi:hypothetical protein
MRLKTVALSLALLFSLIFYLPASNALNVPIENFNFELSDGEDNFLPTHGTWYDGDITGWEHSGNGSGGIETYGIWAPTSNILTTTNANEDYIGYLRNGTLTQNLGFAVQENVIYTVGIDIGNRSDQDPFPDYSIGLLAGDDELVRWENRTTPEDGVFESLVLRYTLTDEDFSNFGGEYLSLEIVSFGTQINFDNVSMTNDDVTAPVPEPTTLILVSSGLAGLAFFRRKRSIKT